MIFSHSPNLRVKSAGNWKSPMKNCLKLEPISPARKAGVIGSLEIINHTLKIHKSKFINHKS